MDTFTLRAQVSTLRDVNVDSEYLKDRIFKELSMKLAECLVENHDMVKVRYDDRSNMDIHSVDLIVGTRLGIKFAIDRALRTGVIDF